MHAPVIDGPLALVIIALGLVAHVVNRKATRPEVFMLIYSGGLSAAVTAFLAYLVVGAVSTSGSQRGAFIGEAILVGCFAIGLVAMTMRIAARYRAGRAPR